MSAGHLISSDCPLVYLTITWGAAARTARVAMMVNKVNVIRQRRSRTMAANFQSPSMEADSSSSRILSVITLIYFKMRESSLGTPVGNDDAVLSSFSVLPELLINPPFF